MRVVSKSTRTMYAYIVLTLLVYIDASVRYIHWYIHWYMASWDELICVERSCKTRWQARNIMPILCADNDSDLQLITLNAIQN